LFLPLIGFFALVATSRFIERRWAGLVACTTILLSFLCFIGLLLAYSQGKWSSETLTLFPWIHFNRINADFTLHLDALSLLMTLIITGVGFLIHVYSNGYMDHEEDFARYFAFLNFFVFAMLLLVLAGDLLVLFVGWEGVGLASYLLIGFWYQRPAAAQAATKAFVVNRVGDLGFLLGLLLTFYLFGTSNIAEVIQQAGQKFAVGAPLITVLTLLYFIGATGKSAQIPLHTWLPDAMEGPTPVSALIHAATMVTAGVYLVVRLHPVYQLAPETLVIIGVIGAVTALYAALCALGQTDLKRVLAYSTVSQLGFMFVACGVGAFYAAMFHLTMHAFVKALLFLSAGNVVHMMQGTTEMAQMGGLSKILPKTNWLFLIGVLALSGIPPLAAFFSKDLILEEVALTGFTTLFYLSLAASILTAFYMTRAYCLTFTGAPRLENHLLKLVKEAPSIMLIPVSVLAVLSIFGGFLAIDFGRAPALERFLEQVGVTLAVPTHGFLTLSTYLAVGGAILAVILAAVLYTRFADRLGPPFALLRKSFYIDDIYEWLFVRPLKAFSRFIIDFTEPVIFDGSIRVVEQATMKTAHELQKIQSGQIRSYVAWMVIGMALLFVYFVF
jgi:NADH-quinone oxidoreductase subunit L